MTPTDLPGDVLSVLGQLFAAGREAVHDGDAATARQVVTSAETVAANKLPESAFRDRLRHGCRRVRDALDDGDDDAAAEYFAAMARAVDERR